MGQVGERPNVALQAKLSENFDFSARTLEESKAATSTEESKSAAVEDIKQEEDDDDDGADGFFDNF